MTVITSRQHLSDLSSTPPFFGGNSLYIAFARISNILLNNFDMDIDEIDCGEISYDRNTDSIRLTAEFVARRAII